MKTVKLTPTEVEVILEALNEKKICEGRCFFNYTASGMCERTTPEGKPACKLLQAIASIQEKLS